MPLSFKIGDITNLKVDAIVNAANSSLLGGGGVDGAIHKAAGPELREFNKTLGGCKVSEAKISPGFNLPSKHVISVVGPIYKGGSFNEEELLYNTYQNALRLAVKEKIKSIAFPLISSGAYGYPVDKAIEVAIRSITDFLDKEDLDVTLIFFNEDTIHHLGDEVYEDLLNYIDDMLEVQFHKIIAHEEIDVDFMKERSVKDTARTLADPDELFHERMNKIMIKKDLTSDQVYKRANIDRRLFSKILGGGNPSKKTAILITLALELNIDESLDLLSRAGYTLSPAIKEDIVVRWHIEKGIHSVYDVSLTQYKLGLKPLF